MPLYRKKPVTIEAVQWTGQNIAEMIDFKVPYHQENHRLMIHTVEGDLNASVNDWIIKGVKGEYYSCKPDIFEATYEAVL